MISKIKWMEVPKSISPKKTLRPFFIGSLPQVLAGVHAIQLFLGIASPMEMLIRMNINFFKFEQ